MFAVAFCVLPLAIPCSVVVDSKHIWYPHFLRRRHNTCLLPDLCPCTPEIKVIEKWEFNQVVTNIFASLFHQADSCYCLVTVAAVVASSFRCAATYAVEFITHHQRICKKEYDIEKEFCGSVVMDFQSYVCYFSKFRVHTSIAHELSSRLCKDVQAILKDRSAHRLFAIRVRNIFPKAQAVRSKQINHTSQRVENIADLSLPLSHL